MKNHIGVLLYFSLLLVIGIDFGQEMPKEHLPLLTLFFGADFEFFLSSYIGGLGAILALGGGAGFLGFGARHCVLVWKQGQAYTDVGFFEVASMLIALTIGIVLSAIYWWPYLNLIYFAPPK